MRLSKMSKPILPVLCVLFVLATACKEKKDTAKQQNTAGPVIVDVLVTAPQSIDNKIDASGTVVAYESVDLHPEVSGRITYLEVPEGKLVTAGTIIARINDADLQAQLAKSKVQLELAEVTEARDKKLLDINGINQSDYDIAHNQVASIKTDIAYTQALIDKTVIRAPFNGVVGLRQVSIGAYVTPANVIATMQQVNKIKIDFTLPEQYSSIIKKGNTVDVDMDATTHQKRKAIIMATEPQVTTTTRNLKVRALLDGGSANPGAFVRVSVNAGEDKKALMIPTNSLIPDDKNNQVVVIKDGKSTFVNVTTGIRLANNVEITKGVNAGDTVVVTGVLFVKPKAPVKIRSVKTLKEFADINNNVQPQ